MRFKRYIKFEKKLSDMTREVENKRWIIFMSAPFWFRLKFLFDNRMLISIKDEN